MAICDLKSYFFYFGGESRFLFCSFFFYQWEKADGNTRRLDSLAPRIDDEQEELTLEPPRRLSLEIRTNV